MCRRLIAASVVGLISASGSAQTVLYVDDDLSPLPPAIEDGLTWATAFNTLKEALSEAESLNAVATGPQDTIVEIRIAGGTYTVSSDRFEAFELVPGVSLLGGFRGGTGANAGDRDLDTFETVFTSDLNGDDDTTFPIDLTVNKGDNTFFMFRADGIGFNTSTTRVDGVTITGGSLAEGSETSGVFEFLNGARLTLSRVYFKNLLVTDIFKDELLVETRIDPVDGPFQVTVAASYSLLIEQSRFENVLGASDFFAGSLIPTEYPLGTIYGPLVVRNTSFRDITNFDDFFNDPDIGLIESYGASIQNCSFHNIKGFFGRISVDESGVNPDFEFVNSTFNSIQSNSTLGDWPANFSSSPSSGRVIVANCIFTNYDDIRFEDNVPFYSTYLETGLLDSGNPPLLPDGVMLTSVDGAIAYFNGPAGDLRPTSLSPVIDSGNDSYATTVVLDPDRDGFPTVDVFVDLGERGRVFGTGVDIGAFEYHDTCGNGSSDWELAGTVGFADSNGNDIPDVCEADCDGNSIADSVDIEGGRADLNQNGIPDDVFLPSSPAPGDCGEIDCDGGGQADDLDIFLGVYNDADLDGVPDVVGCDTDCNSDGLADSAQCILDVVFLLDSSGSLTDRAEEVCLLMDTVEGILQDPIRNPNTVVTRYQLAANSFSTAAFSSCGLDGGLNDFFMSGELGNANSMTMTTDPCFGNDEGANDNDPSDDLEVHPEGWGDAVALVSGNRNWNTASGRVIVVIADEGACDGDNNNNGPDIDPGAVDAKDQSSVQNAIAVSNANGVNVITVMLDSANQTTLDYASDLAAGTSGAAIDLAAYTARGGMVSAAEDIASSMLTLENVQCIECEDTSCVADINGDGFVDNGDISAFVAFFLAQDSAADINGDQIVDNGDISAFVDAFLAGCD